MTLRDNVRAIIECCFSESKEEIQKMAVDSIMKLLVDNGKGNTGLEWHQPDDMPEERPIDNYKYKVTYSYPVLALTDEGYLVTFSRNGVWEELNMAGNKLYKWAYIE